MVRPAADGSLILVDVPYSQQCDDDDDDMMSGGGAWRVYPEDDYSYSYRMLPTYEYGGSEPPPPLPPPPVSVPPGASGLLFDHRRSEFERGLQQVCGGEPGGEVWSVAARNTRR